MRYPKFFINSVLLFTIPSIAAYPQGDVPVITVYSQEQSIEIGQTQTQNHFFYSYDNILNLLEQPGIPEIFRVKISSGGAGIKYIPPENTHISIRLMPGKPHSPNPCQQRPYVIQMHNGVAIDKFGN